MFFYYILAGISLPIYRMGIASTDNYACMVDIDYIAHYQFNVNLTLIYPHMLVEKQP